MFLLRGSSGIILIAFVGCDLLAAQPTNPADQSNAKPRAAIERKSTQAPGAISPPAASPSKATVETAERLEGGDGNKFIAE
jgi:hypothetical protein